MEIVTVWLIFAALAGAFANSRGRSFGGVFLLSLLLSPLIGFIYVLVMKPLPTDAERQAAANAVKCPFCAETIKAEAVVCRFCGRDLPVFAASSAITPQDDYKGDPRKGVVWLILIIAGVIGIVAVLMLGL